MNGMISLNRRIIQVTQIQGYLFYNSILKMTSANVTSVSHIKLIHMEHTVLNDGTYMWCWNPITLCTIIRNHW